MIRKYLISFSLLILVSYGAYTLFDSLFSSKKVKINTLLTPKEPIPNLSFTDIHQNNIQLTDFKDKIIILNFWASWCPPCIKEFPSLIQLIKSNQGKIILVAISSDYTLKDLKMFLKNAPSLSKNVFIVWDQSQEYTQKLLVKKLPETFIIKNLKVLKQVSGYESWTSQYWKHFFENL